MVSYLKGNYSIRRRKGALSARSTSKRTVRTVEEEFERRALEKLGGSIAFVVKSTFVWNGEQSEESGKRPA